jgi:hypothetical protein
MPDFATLDWLHAALWALAICCVLAITFAFLFLATVFVSVLLPGGPTDDEIAAAETVANTGGAANDPPVAPTTGCASVAPAPKRHSLPTLLPPPYLTPLTTPQPGTPVDRPPVCPPPLTPHMPAPFALPAETFSVLSRDDLEALADVAIRFDHSPRDARGDPTDPLTSPHWRDANRVYLDDDWRWPTWADQSLRVNLLGYANDLPFYAPPSEPHIWPYTGPERPTRWGYQGPFWREPRDAWVDNVDWDDDMKGSA